MRKTRPPTGASPQGAWRPETLAERHRRLNAPATIPGAAGTGAPNAGTSAVAAHGVQPLRGGRLGRISTRL